MKECCHAIFAGMPFERYPIHLNIETVLCGIFWLDAFPNKNNVSPTLNPCETFTGRSINLAHCYLETGFYCQTQKSSNNSMQSRTKGAIALQPSGNSQGGCSFFSLTTNYYLHRNHLTTLSIPQGLACRNLPGAFLPTVIVIPLRTTKTALRRMTTVLKMNMTTFPLTTAPKMAHTTQTLTRPPPCVMVFPKEWCLTLKTKITNRIPRPQPTRMMPTLKIHH